jgi:pimeloyl-ACP methyl ester carboxylesterase
MPFVRAPDGVRLKYELEGNGPSVLLHLGAGCDSELWQAAGYLQPLSSSYRCILYDHRGHGESDHPRGRETHHIDRYLADVIALLDHLELERCAFWGYSSGISTGVRLAEAHPARVWALIASGAFSYTKPEQYAQSVAKRVSEQREHGWEKMLERFDVNEREPVPIWMKDRIRATDIEQFNDYLESALTWNWDDWEAIAHVQAPTLFITGELEDPEDGTAEAVRRMPNGTRVRLVGLGHINAFLRSDLVLPYVTNFLAKHAPK